jgi:hypothetical protein
MHYSSLSLPVCLSVCLRVVASQTEETSSSVFIFCFWGKLSPNLELKNIDFEQGQNSPDFEAFFFNFIFPKSPYFYDPFLLFSR